MSSPYAPHTEQETREMLDALGVDAEADLFDIPEEVAFDGRFGIDPADERTVRADLEATFARNDRLVEFLGRGHYDHYVPSLVSDLSRRSEFLTSYTQYQPEVTQGFLQALFEYQSMLVELTGLPVANCSMYDAATALAEAALLSSRARSTSGSRILVPDLLHEGRRGTLENYVEGVGLTVDSYPHDDGNVDLDALADLIDDDVAMVYAENPTVRGTIEESLAAVGELAHDADALFCLGSDLLALSLLQEPASVGADVVVGDASALGLPTSYGMGLGLFATKAEFLRQVPGRLVGTSVDAAGRRAYTLTLQTREQHIRKERATSNICTNQAWVALRTAMHVATLGPGGLVDLAETCVREARDLAAAIDDLSGFRAPIHDRHHFREFVVHTDQPAPAIARDVEGEGFAVHVVGDHRLQVCVTEQNAEHAAALVEALGGRSMIYDQARYTEDDTVHEPLLSEKDETRVEVDSSLPDGLTRDSLSLPELSEPELARHYTRLSQMNYGVESGPYPLGSCTMKYNPSFTEDVAAAPVPNAAVHPDRSERSVQGTLKVLHGLQDYLGRIGGMNAVTLQPPAGAAGEFTGILVARAYHEDRDDERSEVIIPASAHGTNFASAAMAGYDVVELPSDEDGRVDMDALRAAVSEETAALMLTNPNTVGLFERDIADIAEIVHDVGGLLYYDGANLNALLGRARPGDMGFDIMHYNVHKTFATPHGGGGPGAGPVGVTEELAPYLPSPRVREIEQGYELFDPERTIGTVHGYQGNWLVLVKAYAYIARLGDAGLRDASAKAVLNANYLASQIDFDVPYGPFHHEFAATAGEQDAAEVAKRMLDFGVHPPTTKWPAFVPEAMLTEPTEIENRKSLDDLAQAFNTAAGEDRETLAEAPHRTTARRIDQVRAARDPHLSWQSLDDE